MTLEELKIAGEVPEWFQQEGLSTVQKGYLLPGETVKGAYKRVAKTASTLLKKPEIEDKIFKYLWNGWICLSTPAFSNFGTSRGLPIACYSSHVADTTQDIFDKIKETGLLSKYGGGTGKYYGDVRGRDAPISGGGKSDGVIPWMKIDEATIAAVSQVGVRRGSEAVYLPSWHPDFEEFIDIRRQTGDLSRRCLGVGFHHGACLDDDFMNKVIAGEGKEKELFKKILIARVETGEPYLLFTDTVNKANPQCYKDKQFKVSTSNLCNEITLYTDPLHTFVCCLSSLNLNLWDDFKDTDVFEIAIYLLDAVMEEFIQKAKKITGFENAVRFAEKSRALGLGVLGWHTLLQSKMIPFESFQAMQLNNEIFKTIKEKTDEATKKLALEYGEPEWCKGYGVRNSHLTSVAPTTSNSLINGGVSQGIEPIAANSYSQRSAKGTFIRKNPHLQKLLLSKGKDIFETWNNINENKGSVKNLDFLSDFEKEVFLTAREINQKSIIQQAAQRQKYISQSQSVNVFFNMPTKIEPKERKDLGKYIWDVHIMAWQLGLKGLYYFKSESVFKAENNIVSSDCKSCEG